MTVTQRDYLAQKAYYAEQARVAAHDRLIRAALANREPRDRPVARVLAWLGARLVAWGTSLREYGRVVAPPIPQSAQSTRGR
jgi:hypothetical protein